MGRSITTKRIEITPQIKKLQKLAMEAKSIDCDVSVDITQDLVTINGYRKMTYIEAESYLVALMDPTRPERKITTHTVPDAELEAKLARQKEKEQKKHREPGAPPALKALIRRAKRIFKKASIKQESALAGDMPPLEKAQKYINSKASNDEDKATATEALTKYAEEY